MGFKIWSLIDFVKEMQINTVNTSCESEGVPRRLLFDDRSKHITCIITVTSRSQFELQDVKILQVLHPNFTV